MTDLSTPEKPASIPGGSLAIILKLETEIRSQTSEEELGFHSVNATRQLLNQRQAFVFKSRNDGKSFAMFGASSLDAIDRMSPFVRAMEHALSDAAFNGANKVTQAVVLPSGPVTEQNEQGGNFPFKHAIWAPMHLHNGTCFGGLLFCHEEIWSDNSVTIADRLGKMYGYAWNAVVGKKRLQKKSLIRRLMPALIGVALLGAGAIKVPQTIVAPAEIIAKEAGIIAAPIRGVLRHVLVQNEQSVSRGQLLIEYDDAALRSDLEVANRKVNVANARLQRAEQLSFTDPDAKSEIVVLQSELELRRAEQQFAQYRLDQSKIQASETGIALIEDSDHWRGRSVEIGERILSIAKQDQIELRIDLALSDAIALKEGAKIRVFLDVDPLNSYSGRLVSSDFNATATKSGELAYKTYAKFDDSQPTESLRIGLRGAAQIYGEDVRLAFLIFRRPIGAFRQFFGF